MLAYLQKVLEGNKPITFDDVATSPWTSGVLGGIDKRISQKIDGMAYNQLSEKLKQFGYDRTYRRNLMRSVKKKFGDLKIGDELPKGVKFEPPNWLKLAKGFGVASTALAGVTGTIAAGVTAVAGVFLAPEIAAGVGVAVAGVAVAAVACGVASYAASTVKGWFGLK
ncbi:hypothetical protein [Clostridium sp. JS66]|uniref:hypothetical protein n=1 Tax=Clostridium sp. JS66 TaxID=3064705 RepID=UPI00298D9546|nr:hypothetical protein [Clostridium sp. JS66]WPC41628.1 hypothetical protein Q6H37_27805 [Clostridium sp. JS66]